MAAVTSAATAAAARIGAALSDAQYFESSMVRVEDIRRQLDSRSIKEKLDAMKRVVALISLGKDASTFFPDVVKNVVAPSLDVKKLVYLYLVHYAEEKQDLALLAINSFQKDLSDHNQHIRALSLRVLSSIRVKVILQVVIHAINKAAKDASSYVRKAAAHAIGKVCALDAASKEMLMQPLQDLVSDRSTQVMGSAIAAFEEVCPCNWALIHPHYRRICGALSDVEPWGQITIINMLLRYSRIHFEDPAKEGEKGSAKRRNPDLTVLLDSVAPLFFSLNNSVVASTIAVYYHLATKEEFLGMAIKPLMRLVAIQDDGGQAVALNIAGVVASRYPSVLIPYVSEFYVSAAHSAPIRALRIKVLTKICVAAGEDGGIGSKPNARRALLAELKEYLFGRDRGLASSSARAIGCLATAHPGSTPAIVKVLSSVVGTADNPSVVTESIAVLRRLLQRHPSAQAKALPQLIAMLLADSESDIGSIKEPAARASIIWLIGAFYEKVLIVAAEALRLLARGFVHEAAEVKLQIMNLAAKVVAWRELGKDTMVPDAGVAGTVPPHVGMKLLEYVLACARYDRDYDVRDKARMMQAIFMSTPRSPLFEATCEAYIARKPIPTTLDVYGSATHVPDDALGSDVIIGSLAHVLTGRRLPGFRPLAPWAETDTASLLRDEGAAGTESASFNREYKGVSSADYNGSGPTTQSGSGLWGAAAGLPSLAGLVNGTALARGDPGPSFSGDFDMHSQRQSLATEEYSNIDPERFYESGTEESSEYDSSSGDEDSDQQSVPGNSARPQTPHDSGMETLVPELLLGTDDAAMSSKDPPTAKKESSEYDLDALLGSMSVANTGSENKMVARTQDLTGRAGSPWSRIVEAWNGGGLEVDASFLRRASSAGPEVTPVVLRVANRGQASVSNIYFSSLTGDCFSCTQSIPTLDANEVKDVRADSRFRGKTAGVRFNLLIDGKPSSTGEFKPTVGYVIRPNPGMTPGEFMATEKSLQGMFGSEAQISMPCPKNNDWIGLANIVREQILDACFAAHVKTAVGGQSLDDNERFSILFAGFLPSPQVSSKEKRHILIRCTVVSGADNSECSCKLWIGCEEILFAANLMRACKKALQASDQQR